MLLITLTVFVAAFAVSAPAATAASWNLARDLRANALSASPLNPFPDSYGNLPVWELMVAAGTMRDSSTYSDMTLDISDPCATPRVVAWTQGARADVVGVVEVNTTDTTIHGMRCAPSAVEPPHQVFLHPGPSNDSLVAWHSPITGTVSVSGRIADADCGGGDGVAWFVDQGGVDIASGSIDNCGAQRFPSGLTLQVTTGTTLYFLIDPKADYGWDLTETDLTIQQVRQTVTLLNCSPQNVIVALPTTCTARVTDVDGGRALTPTGTVTFATNRPGTFSSKRCTLSGSAATATCQVTYTPRVRGRGEHALTASYGGDSTHTASTGHTIVAVTGRPTSITINCQQAALTVGQPTLCATTVTDSASGPAITPNGTVNFTGTMTDSFYANRCTLSTSSDGTASCEVSYTPTAVGTGRHTITARYRGDPTHARSSGQTTITVTRPGTPAPGRT